MLKQWQICIVLWDLYQVANVGLPINLLLIELIFFSFLLPINQGSQLIIIVSISSSLDQISIFQFLWKPSLGFFKFNQFNHEFEWFIFVPWLMNTILDKFSNFRTVLKCLTGADKSNCKVHHEFKKISLK